MTDLSHLSDEEILKAAGVKPDLSFYSDAQIMEAAGINPPAGFFGRMKDDFNQRVANDRESFDMYRNGQQSLGSAALQTVGQGAGYIGDTVGNIAGSAARSAYDLASTHGTDNATKFVKRQLNNSETMQDVSSAVGGAADYLNKNYPVTTRDAGALFNIATAIPSVKALQEVGAGVKTAAPQVGSDLLSVAKKQFADRRFEAVKELTLPKQTAREVADTALQRSSRGLMNEQFYQPTPYETEMIKTAAASGVKKSLPLVDNIQILNAAKNKEAQALKFALDKANIQIPPAAYAQYGQSIVAKIAENPLVDEDGATVRKLLESAQKSIDANPKTAAGVLQARKDFDRAISQFQPSALDTDSPATAFRFTAKQIRQGMNQLIEDSVPDAGVKASLTKQSHLYDAIENMSSKVSEQETNRLTRFGKTKTGRALKYGAYVAGAGELGNYVYHKTAPSIGGDY